MSRLRLESRIRLNTYQGTPLLWLQRSDGTFLGEWSLRGSRKNGMISRSMPESSKKPPDGLGDAFGTNISTSCSGVERP